MGGEIGVDSELGNGSEFYFTAIFDNQSYVVSSAEKSLPTIQGKHVLFVDDNASSRKINEKIMRSMGLEVTALSSGNTVLAELELGLKDSQHPRFDLVVVDWDMPDMDGIATVEGIRARTKFDNLPILMMISSYGIDRFKSIIDRGIVDGLINKPVVPSTAAKIIRGILDHDSDHEPSESIHSADQEHHQTPYLAGLRVLLVEDNEINQEIAGKILEGMGIQVSVANNGNEAIERIFVSDHKLTYDAVLMDLQMPEMDGFQATKRIRQDQRFDGIPIIAMTAHAFESEKTKCFDAGMQDHVSKPIEPDRLALALSNCINFESKQLSDNLKRQRSRTLKSASETEINADVSLSTVDLTAAKKMLNNDASLLTRMLHKFAEEKEDTIDTVRKQVDSGEHESAAHAAHRIKGIAGNLHITELFDSTSRLEYALNNEKVDEANLLLEKVESEFSRFTEELTALDKNNLALSTPSHPQPDSNKKPDCRQKTLELLDQFIAFLDADNFKAEYYLSLLNPHLKGTFDHELGQLLEFVTELNFKVAANTAREIRAQISEPCQI